MIELKAILCALHDTTERWNANPSFIPRDGEIVFYSDYGRQTDDEGVEHSVPGIKIGDGQTYLVDLPFVGASDRDAISQTLQNHIDDTDAHITSEERIRWNRKLDDAYTSDEILVITRDLI